MIIDFCLHYYSYQCLSLRNSNLSLV